MPKCIRTPGEVKVHTTLPERENGSKPSSQSSENPLHIRSGVTRKLHSVELHAAASGRRSTFRLFTGHCKYGERALVYRVPLSLRAKCEYGAGRVEGNDSKSAGKSVVCCDVA